MLKHKIELADGGILTSGTGTGDAIRSVRVTEQVSDGTDLCPGSACAACAELEIWAPENRLSIAQGDELKLFCRDTETGTESQVGVFLAEKPEKTSANVYKVTAYDRMTLLEKDLSPWLREQQENFPMVLPSFIRQVCEQCGVHLVGGTLDGIPNSGYVIGAFYADNLTGRQLIRWAAQACCRFVRMTPLGQLEFGWYTPSTAQDAIIGPGGGLRPTALRLSGMVLRTVRDQVWRFGRRQNGYLEGSLSYEDYRTAPIDKVQIRQSDEDVGVIYPPEETGTNTLVLQGNLLLTATTADRLEPVARAIYEVMQGVSYTPLKVSVQAGITSVTAGTILTVEDAYGRQMQAYITQRTLSGQTLTLESTGNPRRDSVSAVNRQKYTNLDGRLLEIRTSIDGLKVTASNLAGDISSLELTLDGLEVKVSDTNGNVSALKQTVTGLQTKVTDAQGNISTLTQTVNGLKTTVSGKIDSTTAKTLIDQSLKGLTLSASAGSKSTTLTLKAGSTTLTSASITFTGFVAFADLSTAGKTTINGANIKTGIVLSNSGNTRLDLDNGVFQVGKDSVNYVHLEPSGITWRGGTDSDGATAHGHIQATEDRLWITSDTRYQMLGWKHEANGSYQCLELEQVDNAVSVPNRLNVGGVCSVRTLLAWDAKERVVQTENWGSRGMAAMESPEPLFFDAGSGVLDEGGVCCIESNPIYEETTSTTVERRWYVTPTAPGELWVEKKSWGAVIHGPPGLTFDWMVGSIQRGYEGVYTEVSTDRYPAVSYSPGDGLNEKVLQDVFGPILATESEGT